MHTNSSSATWATPFLSHKNTIGYINDTTAQNNPHFLPWDNPDNLMTLEQLEMTTIITNCVLSPILFLVGVPTNIISCLVFYKQGLRDRMNLCLFVLALVDTVYLVSVFVIGIHSFIGLWDEEFGREYNMKMSVYFNWIMWGMRAASGCITMVIACERCVCVVFPLRANSIMRTRTMGALLAAIVIVFTLGNAYNLLNFRVLEVRDPVTGQTHYVMTANEFMVKYQMVYVILNETILSISVPIVTFVVVGVATAITVIKLRTAIAWRASTSSGRGDNQNQQQQAALTKMLVILSCVFMACSLPLTAISFVRVFVPDFSPDGRYYNFVIASHVVSIHFICAVNSAINFFVYYSRSSRFKQDLRKLCSCTDSRNGVESATTVSNILPSFGKRV